MGYFRCWSVRNVLDLHVDGRLTSTAARRVESHLSSCAACQAAAREFGGVKRLLKKAPRVDIPKGLASSVLKQLEAGVEVRPRPMLLGSLLRLSLPQAAALAYLTLLLGVNLQPGAPSQGRGIAPPWALGEGKR